ncbi:MAG: hypothetical protein EXQ48_04685 [Acidobacteria bacterium]|nr:hypothetical protein [Acidobacteriota bacterium]
MNVLRRLLVVGVLLILPVKAFAQEATLTGTVTDSTGAVLPANYLKPVDGQFRTMQFGFRLSF